MVLEISKFLNKKPKIDKTVFIAEGSNVIGSVEIKKNSSVWFNCAIRADVNFISIGEKTNIQDGTIIHVSSGGFSATGGAGSPTIIGDNVTIGGQAGFAGHISIGQNVVIAAKSGVTKNIKDNSVVAGFPAIDMKEWKKSVIRQRKYGH